jgi:hypothetical protein
MDYYDQLICEVLGPAIVLALAVASKEVFAPCN